MIIPFWSGTTALDLRQAYRKGRQRWARDPKQVVPDAAGIFQDPLDLNSVETEVTAAESPWQAGITETSDRAFKLVHRKMLDSTRPKDKRQYEECVDATVSARNVLLRTHGFSPCQHVFGRDPELAFDVLVPEVDVAAVTICLFLIAPVNALPIFARQHDRLSWKVRTTELCGVPRWQDRVRGGSSRSEIKLRSGERARVVA